VQREHQKATKKDLMNAGKRLGNSNVGGVKVFDAEYREREIGGCIIGKNLIIPRCHPKRNGDAKSHLSGY